MTDNQLWNEHWDAVLSQGPRCPPVVNFKLGRGGVLNYWAEHAGTASTCPDALQGLYELGFLHGRLAAIEEMS